MKDSKNIFCTFENSVRRKPCCRRCVLIMFKFLSFIFSPPLFNHSTSDVSHFRRLFYFVFNMRGLLFVAVDKTFCFAFISLRTSLLSFSISLIFLSFSCFMCSLGSSRTQEFSPTNLCSKFSHHRVFITHVRSYNPALLYLLQKIQKILQVFV